MAQENMVYIMEYYSVCKKKKIPPYVTAWVNPEDILVTEASHRKTNGA